MTKKEEENVIYEYETALMIMLNNALLERLLDVNESLEESVRRVCVVNVLTALLEFYLELTQAPEEVLQKCLLEPYKKLSEAFKTNEPTDPMIVALQILEKQLKEFEKDE
jgi:hypothetical protein